MAVITYREALNQALREEMKRDPSVFLIGEEVGFYNGAFGVSKGLLEEFGEMRVRDTPIAEEVIAGVGIGAAMVGLRPVVEMMTFNFALLAIDQIVNNAAKIRYMSGGQYKIPVVIRGPGGAGRQLSSQHSQSLESYFVYVPGLKVVMPSTPADAKGLLKTAIRDDNPVIFIESEVLYGTKGEVPEGELLIPFGAADIKRKGKDITVITYSKMVHVVLQAAQELEKTGIDAEVIDIRTLKPLDMETLVNSIRKTHRAVIVQEGWRLTGMAAEIASSLTESAFDFLDAPILRVTGEDAPMPYAKNLEESAIPSKEKVIEAVKGLMGLK